MRKKQNKRPIVLRLQTNLEKEIVIEPVDLQPSHGFWERYFFLGSLLCHGRGFEFLFHVTGGGLALSSSAFVLQLLSEGGELGTRYGRAAFGILLFQDLAIVPMMVLTPLLATAGGGGSAMLVRAVSVAAGKGIIALIVIFALGKLLLEPTFKFVAKVSCCKGSDVVHVFGTACWKEAKWKESWQESFLYPCSDSVVSDPCCVLVYHLRCGGTLPLRFLFLLSCPVKVLGGICGDDLVHSISDFNVDGGNGTV